ncbi:unknown [Suid gammaherpesvirus 3]|uniref:Tegument protein G48 n=1 Tax=Suid gammaherpesvirus 3 TaxID=1960249 RepID=Q8JJQ0_9GAMA|nr:unknown [Porcine lymphotropic herpesvirus 1]AAM22147.1 unknown [Porcine lymphotropic herpesvirus 1]
MELTVPVAGVDAENMQHWQSIFDGFSLHGNVRACLGSLKRFFKAHDHSGLCASILILGGLVQDEKYANTEKELLGTALLVRMGAEYTYSMLTDTERQESVETMFLECRERLVAMLLSECGCIDCHSSVKSLKSAALLKRLPRLNPHTIHSYDSMLTKLYNSVILSNSMSINHNILINILQDISYEDGFDKQQCDAELLAMCMILCWIFALLRFIIIENQTIILENLLSFSKLYKSDCGDNSKSMEQQIVSNLQSLSHKGSHMHTFLYPDLLTIKIDRNRVNLHNGLGNIQSFQTLKEIIDSKQRPSSLRVSQRYVHQCPETEPETYLVDNVAEPYGISDEHLKGLWTLDVLVDDSEEVNVDQTDNTLYNKSDDTTQDTCDILDVSPTRLHDLSDNGDDIGDYKEDDIGDYKEDDIGDDKEDDIGDYKEDDFGDYNISNYNLDEEFSYLTLDEFEQRMYDDTKFQESPIYKDVYIPLGHEEERLKNAEKFEDVYYREFI